MTLKFFSQQRAVPICLLILAVLVSFYDVVFLGKTLKVSTTNSQAVPGHAYGQENNKLRFLPVHGTDSPVQEEPIYEFIKQSIKQGIWPLWNPHQACGYPLFAMLEVGMYFPLNFILYLVHEQYSWDILILLRIFLAGFLMYWLMRELGLTRTAALGSGLAFMLSGPFILIQFWTINVDILLPLIIIAVNRVCLRANVSNLIFLALAVFLSVLAGHPEHVFLINAYGIFFFLFRVLTLYIARPRARAYHNSLIVYLFGNALGIALSAFALFPFIYHFLFEFWHGHPAGTGLLMEEQAGRAITVILPHFFQRVPLTHRWQYAGWFGGYLGTIPCALAVLSLFRQQRQGLNYFFALMALATLAKAYSLPVINWIGYLPVFDAVRYAIHSPQLVAFSVAALTGMGIRAVELDRHLLRKSLVFIFAVIVFAGLNFWGHRGQLDLPTAARACLFAAALIGLLEIVLWLRQKKIIATALASGLLALLIFCELFLYIHREHARRFSSFPEVPYIEKLKRSPLRVRSYGSFWAFYPSTASGFGVDDLGFFFGLVPKRFVKFSNVLLIKNYFKNDLRPPALRAFPILGQDHILDLLNVKYLILPSNPRFYAQFNLYRQMKLPPLVYNREVRVFERPTAFPRVFIVHRAIFEPREQAALAEIDKLGPRLRNVAVITSPLIPDVMARLLTAPIQDNSSARIVKYTPNEVLVEAHMQHPGIVVLGDSYHPDWQVYVNGRPWKILPANYLLRGVFLLPGHYEVKFVFEPRSLKIGAWVSFVTLLILIALHHWGKTQRS